MDKTDFQRALDALKQKEKRKFAQGVDLIINLKGLDLKKPEQQVDVWAQIPHARPKKVRVAALVGPELIEQARKTCDTAILHEDFKKLNNKKAVKKLAREHDYFIAQANIMPDIAKFFGRVLGPRGKMPNPKAGCVVPPNANLGPLTQRLQKTAHVTAKTQLSVKCGIGSEAMPDDQVTENALSVYNAILQALPQEEQNIRNVMLKLTMSAPVPVTPGGKGAAKKEHKAKSAQKQQATAQAQKKPAQNTQPQTPDSKRTPAGEAE